MKRIATLLIILSTISIYSQNINKYKYIVVPQKFDFLKKQDAYQTSSLTKFLFNKYGFTAFFEGEEFPKDLQMNRCSALTAKVVDASKMMKTVNRIQLVDCNGKIVFETMEAVSREKDYKTAYHKTIREAFEGIKSLNYKYRPQNPELYTTPKHVRKIDAPANRLQKQQEKVTKVNNNITTTLIALPTKFGYALFKNENQKVFDVLKTNLPNTFILKNLNGIFYRDRADQWIAEFYDMGSKINQKFKVDFSASK